MFQARLGGAQRDAEAVEHWVPGQGQVASCAVSRPVRVRLAGQINPAVSGVD